MTKSTRLKGDRVLTTTTLGTKLRPRQDHASAAPEPALGAAQTAAMDVALTIAEVCALRARERENKASRPERVKAERRLRRKRQALVQLLGDVPTRALVQALTVDGGVMLRAAREAAPALRDTAVWAAVQAASVAIQRGYQDTASLTMLGAAYQWRAIEQALLARVLKEDVTKDLMKLASLANANSRHSMLTADALSRSGGRPITQPAAVESMADREAAMHAHAMELERRAGRNWDDDDGVIPFSAATGTGPTPSEKTDHSNESGTT